MLIYFKTFVMENICRSFLSVGSSNSSCGSEVSLCQKWALATEICKDFWFISNPSLWFAKQLHALGSAPSCTLALPNLLKYLRLVSQKMGPAVTQIND